MQKILFFYYKITNTACILSYKVLWNPAHHLFFIFQLENILQSHLNFSTSYGRLTDLSGSLCVPIISLRSFFHKKNLRGLILLELDKSKKPKDYSSWMDPEHRLKRIALCLNKCRWIRAARYPHKSAIPVSLYSILIRSHDDLCNFM